MKSRLERILEKLPNQEVELSAQKVELAGNYDFVKYKNEYDKSFGNYRTDYRKGINQAKSAVDKQFSKVSEILNKAEKEMDEFGAAAEELGFDFRKSKKWQEFQDVKKILLSSKSNLNEKQKEISKIL